MDEVQDELTGKYSITGSSELDLRKIAIETFDYKALQRQRILRYFSIPANAVQVEDHNYLAFATSVCAIAQRVEKDLFNPNTFKQIAVILLKYKLYLQCITNMSVEDVIAGYRARGILDHDVLTDCLVTLSKHWCTTNSEGTAIGVCPKKPDLTTTEAVYTIQAFDYIWNCTEVIDGEFDYNGFAPTQTEMNKIIDIPGFSHDDQKRAFDSPKAVGGEGAPTGAGSSSAARDEQTVFGLEGNRRGINVTPSQIRGSSFVPEHLKKTVNHMQKLDAAYRETTSDTKVNYCDIYDTAPATPQGFGRDEVNEFHDKVPYRTGFAICGKGEMEMATTNGDTGPTSVVSRISVTACARSYGTRSSALVITLKTDGST